MKISALLLPAAAVAGAALLLAPRDAQGFSLLGGSLSLSQRDLRVFNNFTDASANNNTIAHAQFPGYDGAEMAIWKGAVEWGSEIHGDGTGDAHQNGTLGSGGANYDPSWQGNATAVGGTNDNIHSELAGSSGGTLAFTESPISDGWRIRYFSTWTWADGPGTSISGVDLQGVACHEFGHAVGIGHTGTGGATMFPSITGTGVNQRSIETDDKNGLAAVYGVKSASKPRITGASPSGGNITITGLNFSASGNEVWFTKSGTGGTGNPVKVTGVTSGGTSITVAVPLGAGKGDILVRNNGTAHANLSNAWPLDPGLPGGGSPPTIASFVPASLTAITADPTSVTVNGNNFNTVTAMSVGGLALGPGAFTIVSNNVITFGYNATTVLGNLPISITNPAGTANASIPVATPVVPILDMVNSDPFFQLNAIGMTFRMSSDVGDTIYMVVSSSNLPSVLPGIVDLGIGNNFTSYSQLGIFTPNPLTGWVEINTGPLGIPAGTTIYSQFAAFPDESGLSLTESSNVQFSLMLF